jgi:hypothetical protein
MREIAAIQDFKITIEQVSGPTNTNDRSEIISEQGNLKEIPKLEIMQDEDGLKEIYNAIMAYVKGKNIQKVSISGDVSFSTNILTIDISRIYIGKK